MFYLSGKQGKKIEPSFFQVIRKKRLRFDIFQETSFSEFIYHKITEGTSEAIQQYEGVPSFLFLLKEVYA